MKLAAIVTLAFTSTLVLAQAPPTLTDAQQKKFFKAQSEAIQAGVQAQQSADKAKQQQATFASVLDELGKVCGDKFSLSLSKDGDLVCQAKAVTHTPTPAPVKK